MPQALVTLTDGRKARVTFDSPEQLDQTIADLNKPQGGVGDAAADTVTSMLGGAAGAVVGGVAGVARGLGAAGAELVNGEGDPRQHMLTAGRVGEAFTDEATRTIEGVQGAFQRATAPQTRSGDFAMRQVAKPFTLLAKGGDKAGQVVSDVTGSPALGAATNAAVQSAPSLIVPGLRVAGRLGRAAPAAAAGVELEAAGAPRTAPSTIGDGPPVAAQEAPGAAGARPAPEAPPGAAQPPPRAANTNEARAEAYARSIGLDWAGLGQGTRQALATIAQDARALERLDPKAVQRQALLERQRVPIPATRAQLTRDPVELRREAIASRTTEGQPIRDVDVEANRALQANLEVLRGRVAGKRGGLHDPTEEGAPSTPSIREGTKVPSEVGGSVLSAAAEKAKWSKKGYDAKYKLARETEPNAEAGLGPVTQLLTENPDIQHLGWVQSWLSKARAARAAKAGVPASEVTMDKVTLAELDDLRKLSQKHGGGTDAHYAGELRKAVDTAMEDVPEGAKAWKAARDAFKKHRAEFADQGSVRQLVARKKGTSDPAVEAEKVWGKIKSGSVKQIREIKNTLLTGGTAATRMAGKRAWRDVRGETVNRILEDARNVVATDEAERQVLTAAALRKTVSGIPRENLEEILGKRTTQELYDLVRAAKITRTQPSARVTESGTVPNALIMAEKILGHIPGGKLVVGGAKALKSLQEKGGAAIAARRATETPLGEAAATVAKTRRKGRARTAIDELEAGGPTLPAPEPTIGQVIPPPKKP